MTSHIESRPTSTTLTTDLARSWLLVPGARMDRFSEAAASNADAVIIDLEDGVAENDKETSRVNVTRWLGTVTGMSGRAWVRINAIDTPHWEADLVALSTLPNLTGIVLPKAERAQEIRATVERLRPGTAVVALVESALGVENVSEIAATEGVTRVAFGINDFRKDTGIGMLDSALDYARSRLVVASRAHGLPNPIDGPSPAAADLSEVASGSLRSKAYGLTGRLCLSVAHIDTVNANLRPSLADVEAAEVIVAGGPGSMGGSYLPKLVAAQATLRLHDIFSACDGASREK